MEMAKYLPHPFHLTSLAVLMSGWGPLITAGIDRRMQSSPHIKGQVRMATIDSGGKGKEDYTFFVLVSGYIHLAQRTVGDSCSVCHTVWPRCPSPSLSVLIFFFFFWSR